jgi:dipeptidyl aminopeptidase/acylaminoacyl peptidase
MLILTVLIRCGAMALLVAVGCATPRSSPRGGEKGARDGATGDALATNAPSGGMSDSPHHDGSSAADASGCGFYHERAVMTSSQVIAEQVSYRSGAYQVNGIVCRPNDARRHATVLFQHGGFGGLGELDWTLDAGGCAFCDSCIASAKSGYVFAASSYRGEDESEGPIEVCAGEVDDVANLQCAIAGTPWSDGRFAAMGASHGGCITLRLAARDATLAGAIASVAPGDLGVMYDWWQTEAAAGYPTCLADTTRGYTTDACAGLYFGLGSVIVSAVGGTPTQVPAAYAARSPVHTAPLIVPTFLLYGTADAIVEQEQACLVRATLHTGRLPFTAWYLDAMGNPVVNPGTTPACGGGFTAGTPPTRDSVAAWPPATYFFLLEGEDHGVLGSPLGTPGIYANAAALTFLAARLPP